ALCPAAAMSAISASRADPARRPRRTAASTRAMHRPRAAASAAGQATGPEIAIAPGVAFAPAIALAPATAEWGWRAGPIRPSAWGPPLGSGLGCGLCLALALVWA